MCRESNDERNERYIDYIKHDPASHKCQVRKLRRRVVFGETHVVPSAVSSRLWQWDFWELPAAARRPSCASSRARQRLLILRKLKQAARCYSAMPTVASLPVAVPNVRRALSREVNRSRFWLFPPSQLFHQDRAAPERRVSYATNSESRFVMCLLWTAQATLL